MLILKDCLALLTLLRAFDLVYFHLCCCFFSVLSFLGLELLYFGMLRGAVLLSREADSTPSENNSGE